MSFRDRTDAGKRLARELRGLKDQHPIVLALPRGGVPVAAQVAHLLDAPLDLVLVRKIGVPFQPELAMGAVVDGPTPLTVRNEDIIEMAGVSEEEFDALRNRELGEINRRRARYLGERSHPELRERVVIVVDDGIATGATTRAALRAVRSRNPKQIILRSLLRRRAPYESCVRKRTRSSAWNNMKTLAPLGSTMTISVSSPMTRSHVPLPSVRPSHRRVPRAGFRQRRFPSKAHPRHRRALSALRITTISMAS